MTEQLRSLVDINPFRFIDFKPAEGKDKERLESECELVLNGSNEINLSGFAKFAANIIRLIGGSRKKSEDLDNILFDLNNYGLSLKDRQNGIGISLQVVYGGIPFTKIMFQDPSATEEILFLENDCMLDISKREVSAGKKSYVFSYVTGKTEEMSDKGSMIRKLKPSEVKSALTKVFNVYKQSTAPAQPPTPTL